MYQKILHQINQSEYDAALQQIEQLDGDEQLGALQATRLWLLTRLGRVEQAEALADELQQQIPSIELYNNRAVLHAARGELKQAEGYLLQALQSDSRYWQVYLNLQHLYATMAKDAYVAALNDSSEPLTELELRPLLFDISQRQERVARLDESDQAELDDLSAIHRAVRRWQQSWQGQNLADYFDNYMEGYHDANIASSREWQQLRRQRILGPDTIEITLRELSLKVVDSETIEALFWMDYRSDNYRDESEKRLRFRRTEGGWKIALEETLTVIRR
ncbi:hypothetical protein D5085_05780 [Ectothiorhodospiraceae bacterium BW-2]|nr:hypothetical protein D5085_05780 [Ectothiorhodospiraceae bacterium BW-2]